MEYLHNDKKQFVEAIDLAVFQTGLEPEVIEKDYYVTMILKKLAEKFAFVVFKGGTSLSKCHRAIKRFSEDIDITIDTALSQGNKRNLKHGLVEIATELGMRIPNLENTRSRRDYNRYELEYDSVLPKVSDTVNASVLLETSFAEVSFPTVLLPVHSYIGDLFEKEAPDAIEQYGLEPFEMKVQSIERTLADKVFAICDYYLEERTKKHSRHIYDIYKLLPLVPQNEEFHKLVKEVRAVRAKTNICPSAQPDVDVPGLLKTIVSDAVYRDDYNNLTIKLLEESDRVSYEQAITAVDKISKGGMFGGTQPTNSSYPSDSL